jgi:hypothetical protein
LLLLRRLLLALLRPPFRLRLLWRSKVLFSQTMHLLLLMLLLLRACCVRLLFQLAACTAA